MSRCEFAIEADPGRCTASFPAFDSLDAAFAAATIPAMTRHGLPPPRILVREGGGEWVPAPVTGRYKPCMRHFHICDYQDGHRHHG